MGPPEQRASDRTAYFTMKTAAGLPPPGTSHTPAGSHSHTPLASPRAPHSVGQPQAPKLSPGAYRGLTQDARTPSPNYFGLAIEPNGDPRDSSLLPRENWSSPTSSVKSFGAAIPKQLPLDANPEFEAFRRQVDLQRGKMGFNLSTSHFNIPTGPVVHTPLASTPSALQRPRPPRWNTHASEGCEAVRPSGSLDGMLRARDVAHTKSDAETGSLQDSAYGSTDSKRNSVTSFNPPNILGLRTHESPAQLELPFPAPSLHRGRPNFSLNILDRPRSALTPIAGRASSSCSPGPGKSPSPKLGPGDPNMMSPDQLRDLLTAESDAKVLILDLRVSPQYAASRVEGALNLCIPTTLLKRATFDLQKLQQTFQAEKDQEKFASWRDTTHLVVYDAQSSDRRDAVSATNMVKKFANEGYSGSTNVLRGGFNAFAAAHPDLVDRTSGRSSPGLSLGGSATPHPHVAPVIGGVLLPTMTSNPNPFFSNIRQNQDLVDGVGQMDVKLPSNIDSSRLPRWLGEASEANDHGKKVSDKFLRIELREQSRMKDAYCVQTHPGTGQSTQPETKVQLSGIEQGGKNRYKDILPFEHARVKLAGRPEGTCDYVNASHIRAKRSYKRYIASQGPLPATFEDFWSVIWDQDVRVIVMLTAESEGGQLKCHPYWKGNDFGPIRLRVLSEKRVSLDIDKHRSESTAGTISTPQAADSSASTQGSSRHPSPAEVGRRRANTTSTVNSPAPAPGSNGSDTPYVIIRKFALSHAAHPFLPIREVTQLHCPSWPDFGAPAQPSHLLALVELSNIIQRASLPSDFPGPLGASATPRNSGFQRGAAKSQAMALSWHDAPESGDHVRPMLVHCSAGCGRTGAFCTVDSVIDMLKRQRLRAVQRANKRIDERERRLAQQMDERARAKRQARGRDSDGDVSMGDEIPPFAPMDEVVERRPSDSYSDREHSSSSSDEMDIDTSWLDDESIDLIAQTVEDFRGQRLSMVQSLRQFVLCYETVIEWVARLQDKGDNSSPGSKGRARSGSLAM
ncbi:hypothetical protein B0T14DRAFT_542959 [Immersiella caudata]|uniref:protein-tyrosine-phosphatase n=1 Tax=Immersiella caudata TaxID=314043 RepID=A0AA39X221_9PEZI|nr:hypothetical protein B0T14DRAFT_542959 [Immersiella caudata]